MTGLDELQPGCLVVDQTYGTLPDDFHPHLHVCALDGGFLPDGRFVKLYDVRRPDLRLIECELQHRILELFENKQRLSPEFRQTMLTWPHSGFSLDASRRILCFRPERAGTPAHVHDPPPL